MGVINLTNYNIQLAHVQGWEKSIFDSAILYFLFIECIGAFNFMDKYRVWPCLYFFFGAIPYSIFDSFCPGYFISL